MNSTTFLASYHWAFAVFLAFILMACQNDSTTQEATNSDNQGQSAAKMIPFPEWAQKSTLYEINVRQFTKEGTLNALMDHLPRIKDLGVDILWLMPIHPIGVKNRKGGLGSPYSIKDYYDINPEFGSKEDFSRFVDECHRLGLKVILDWVTNHTAFDNDWVISNPEWYMKNDSGQITHPEGTDWYDVADLDYSQQGLRSEMKKAVRYWVDSFNIDGYRFDAAWAVGDDVWLEIHEELARSGKPLFLLAESDEATHRNESIFHANYGWVLHHMMGEIAKGIKSPYDIESYMGENEAKYTQGFHLHFTSNHDENSWKGSAPERLGKYNDVMNVLAFTIQGMPLLYGGQESNLNKRLEFFEKDEIEWGDYEKSDFFHSLITLKKENKALWNDPHIINTRLVDWNKEFIHYKRETADNRVDILLNLSDGPYTYTPSAEYKGVSHFSGERLHFYPAKPLIIEPYGFEVMTN